MGGGAGGSGVDEGAGRIGGAACCVGEAVGGGMRGGGIGLDEGGTPCGTCRGDGLGA